MKPVLQVEHVPTIEALARALRTFIADAGDLSVIDVMTNVKVSSSGSKIAHSFRGGVPRWFDFNRDADAAPYQTQPADSRYLYLKADADVTVGLVLF